MTLTRLRAAAQRPGMFGQTVLLLTLVGAVLVGLLAMHTIASSTAGHRQSTMSPISPMSSISLASSVSSVLPGMESHGVATGSRVNELVTGDCGGMCDPGHVMSSMAFVLALVLTGALLFEVASRRGPVVFSALPAVTVPAPYANGPSRPPDLTELSISRT